MAARKDAQPSTDDTGKAVTVVDGQLPAETETVVKTPDNAVTTAEEAKYIYTGPSLPNGMLKENTIFDGRLEDILEYLKDAAEEYPDIKTLIVSVNKFAEQEARKRERGNIVHKRYK